MGHRYSKKIAFYIKFKFSWTGYIFQMFLYPFLKNQSIFNLQYCVRFICTILRLNIFADYISLQIMDVSQLCYIVYLLLVYLYVSNTVV